METEDIKWLDEFQAGLDDMNKYPRNSPEYKTKREAIDKIYQDKMLEIKVQKLFLQGQIEFSQQFSETCKKIGNILNK
jgi:hypothetical protein